MKLTNQTLTNDVQMLIFCLSYIIATVNGLFFIIRVQERHDFDVPITLISYGFGISSM